MFVLRSVIYFILLFFMFEAVALSAVLWSFYESTQNSLKQELLLADHRARDFTLAIAKASELRLNTNGYSELNTTYARYVEVTSKDPEKFLLKKIRLYSPEGLLLSSSDATEVKEELSKRKPNVELTKETYFRKALRMKKWEWPDEDRDVKSNAKDTFPELPKYASIILKFFPLARVNETTTYAPVYHEVKLDVLGAVFVIYERANLTLLFENQFSLLKWMFVNYSLIALVLSILLWGLFFLFQVFSKKEGREINQSPEHITTENANLPLLQKKTVSQATEEISELKQVEPETITNISESKRDMMNPSDKEVLDAIFLG